MRARATCRLFHIVPRHALFRPLCFPLETQGGIQLLNLIADALLVALHDNQRPPCTESHNGCRRPELLVRRNKPNQEHNHHRKHRKKPLLGLPPEPVSAPQTITLHDKTTCRLRTNRIRRWHHRPWRGRGFSSWLSVLLVGGVHSGFLSDGHSAFSAPGCVYFAALACLLLSCLLW